MKVYRDAIDVAQVAGRRPERSRPPPAERLRARAARSRARSTRRPASATTCGYGLELVEQGLEAPALAAFERAAKGDPSAFTLYSLGHALHEERPDREGAARPSSARSSCKPDFAEASNGLGALLAQGGDLPGAIARFRTALDDDARLSGRPQQPRLRAPAVGPATARPTTLYQKALALQPDFPEAFNNLGIYFARQGDMAQAEAYFRQAVAARPGLRRGRRTTWRSC